MRDKALRSKVIRLAYAQPDLRPYLLPLVAGASPRRANDVTVTIDDTEVEIDAIDLVGEMIDRWTEGFLDLLSQYKVTESDVEEALVGVDPEEVNAIYEEQTGITRTAGALDTVRALGGKVMSGAWHTLTHPFISLYKLFTDPTYRGEIARGIKRAISHEVRATKHMVNVGVRLAQGEKVSPQEVKAAAVQFLDLATKVILAYVVGPHLAHMFAHGVLKALATLLSPVDEIAGMLLDKPLRWASQKFLGSSIGLLPSGFYTHF